ncbi:MAG: hypothetical protein Q7S27_01415 [Nanoarchaeota archaeon]|nr:hypothetical protein [Nanoarchaeota archaeon]
MGNLTRLDIWDLSLAGVQLVSLGVIGGALLYGAVKEPQARVRIHYSLPDKIRQYDSDKDGYLDSKEIREWYNSLSKQAEKEE